MFLASQAPVCYSLWFCVSIPEAGCSSCFMKTSILFPVTRPQLSGDLSGDKATAVKERCIAKPESYEERKARRTAEVDGAEDLAKRIAPGAT